MKKSKTTKKVKSAIPQERVKLPTQTPQCIVLYDDGKTPLGVQQEAESIINAVEYREGLVKLKSKFYQEIQEWSRRFGVDADVRVLFTIKNQLKE